jgi:hypothetical protein
MSIEKTRKQYTCEKCVYCTYNRYDYNRHLATQKHLDDQIVDSNSSIECLICKQQYKSQSGLWKHKKICKPVELILKNEVVIAEQPELQNIYNVVKEMSESNAELKQLVITQQLEIKEFMRTAKPPVIIKPTITFNVFLTKHCTDAIIFEDFVKSFNPSEEDVFYIVREGNMKGISTLVNKHISTIPITKRPFHCTDVKRNSVWINTKTGWTNDNEQFYFKKLCAYADRAYSIKGSEVIAANPKYRITETPEYEIYIKMMVALNRSDDQNKALIMKAIEDYIYIGKDQLALLDLN